MSTADTQPPAMSEFHMTKPGFTCVKCGQVDGRCTSSNDRRWANCDKAGGLVHVEAEKPQAANGHANGHAKNGSPATSANGHSANGAASTVIPSATTNESAAPKIVLGTDEHRVIDETIHALQADDEIFHRGGALARVIRNAEGDDRICRPAGAPTIGIASQPWLRERITRHTRLVKIVDNHEQSAHPPQWLTPAVAARGTWPQLRQLVGISDAPILRPDGSIHQSPGFDPGTGVLFIPSAKFTTIPDNSTIDDADAAMGRLAEVFCDFRFEADEHRAALLSGLLTPLARHAFAGPSPLFLADANIRGAGKGLACQCAAEIVLGRPMPVTGYVHDPVEFGKRITSIAIAGDTMILLDNLAGHFGNDALDRALTAERWRDRILGVSQMVDLPLLATWFATGNNVLVGADTARRIIHIRLDVLEEKPEERSDFKNPDLHGWVRQNRPQLLVDALTVLASYIRAGKPDQHLTPYGSFEGWSGLVRSAVVWCGLPDPCKTRERLAEISDTTADVLGQLIAAIAQYDPHDLGFTVSEVVARLYQKDYPPLNDDAVAMRAALEALAGSPPGKAPSPRTIGNRLRGFRRRVVKGSYLDIDQSRQNSAGAVWRLFRPKNEGGE